MSLVIRLAAGGSAVVSALAHFTPELRPWHMAPATPGRAHCMGRSRHRQIICEWKIVVLVRPRLLLLGFVRGKLPSTSKKSQKCIEICDSAFHAQEITPDYILRIPESATVFSWHVRLDWVGAKYSEHDKKKPSTPRVSYYLIGCNLHKCSCQIPADGRIHVRSRNSQNN